MVQTHLIEELLVQLGALSPSGYLAALRIRFVSPLMTFHTFPQPWIDHYTKNGYALRDPIASWGFSQTGTARWSEIDTPDPLGILAQAREYGLRYGTVVSCGPLGSRTLVTSTRADREFRDDELAAISRVVRQLHDCATPPDNLTGAEIEALTLVAGGRRYAAAAEILGISESALKARLASARKKLLAKTNPEAVQRAKDYQIL